MLHTLHAQIDTASMMSRAVMKGVLQNTAINSYVPFEAANHDTNSVDSR